MGSLKQVRIKGLILGQNSNWTVILGIRERERKSVRERETETNSIAFGSLNVKYIFSIFQLTRHNCSAAVDDNYPGARVKEGTAAPILSHFIRAPLQPASLTMSHSCSLIKFSNRLFLLFPSSFYRNYIVKFKI